MQKVKLADVAWEMCMKEERKLLWYGDPQFLQDIYDKWGGKHTHPINSISAVLSACSRSKRWKKDGYIIHLGVRHSVFRLIGEK